MSPRDHDPAGRDALAFFGTLTASATHELNNVLSIVDQVGGLLGDLALRTAAGGSIAPQRLETLRDRIDRQVSKGVEILQHLNRFAHSLDERHEPFDAADVLESLLGLSSRFAELARVRLERLDWVEWRGEGDPFLFQQAVFEGLRSILAQSAEGDRIEIDLQRDGSTGIVSISGTARPDSWESDPGLTRLGRCMHESGGEYRRTTPETGGMTLELRFPSGADGSASADGN